MIRERKCDLGNLKFSACSFGLILCGNLTLSVAKPAMNLKPEQACGFLVPVHKVAKLRHVNLVRDKISITMKKWSAQRKEKGDASHP